MRQWINFYYYLPLERYEAHVLTVELGKEAMTDAQELFDVYQRALGIFECVFSTDDEVMLVINTYPCDGINPHPRSIKPYLKNEQLHRTLNAFMEKGPHEEDIMHYYLTCRWGELKNKKLILHLCQHDLIEGVKPMNDYYFIQLEKKRCVRMQDDRFIDLIFKDETDKTRMIECLLAKNLL